MTVKEACERLGISRAWLSQLLKEGRIKARYGQITEKSVCVYELRRRKPGRPSGSFRVNKKEP